MNVHQAIIQVREKVGYVKRQRPEKGSGISYTVARVEDMIAAVRDHMNEARIDVYPVSSETLDDDVVEVGAKKTRMRRVTLRCGYIFVQADSESKTDVCVVDGEAMDAADKATSKAQTAAFKKLLRQVFVIETGDEDPDMHQPGENGKSSTFVKARASLLAAKESDDQNRVSKVWHHIEQRRGGGLISEDEFNELQEML